MKKNDSIQLNPEDMATLSETFFGALVSIARVAVKQIEAEQEAAGDGPALMRTKQAAEYLAVGKTRLLELRTAGELEVVLVDGNPNVVRYLRTSLDRYIKRMQREHDHGKRD